MIVHKTVASNGDGLEFVLSDDTVDRYGDIVDPDGWDLRNFKKNPIALFGHSSSFPIGTWENVRVENKKLIAKLKFAAKGTSARIDELISLVEQGVLRAVSVGFRPIDSDPIDPKQPWGAQRYKKQELLETSLVSVPANPAAVALAKSLNLSTETMSLAFGEQADVRQRDVSANGKHAALTPNQVRAAAGLPLVPKGKSMTTLSKRIEDAQELLVQKKDKLTELTNDHDLDNDAIESVTHEIDGIERSLANLKASEARIGVNAAPAGANLQAPAIRKPLGVHLREPKPEDLIVRAAVCNVLAFATGKDPIRIMEERYRDHEATQIVVRAAVAGATTTQSGWAAELVETAMGAFMESLRPVAVYPRLAALGTSLSFGPGRAAIKLPARSASPSISGSFVAESAPIPVRRLGLTSVTLSPHKMGVISVFSREIARLSNPAIEGLLRQEIQADTALTIDTLLLDAAAGSATRPAGLTNGVASLTESTAGGYQAILEDIQTLAAPFDAANAGRTLVLLMNPAQARLLKMTPGPNASGFGWAEQFLSEFTVISSTTIPSGNVYMVDAADFATAAGDAPEFDVSEQTVLHMEDTSPAHISAAGTPNIVAAPAQSMFQTAQIALRMILDITWAMRRTGMVQWMDDVSWGPAAE